MRNLEMIKWYVIDIFSFDRLFCSYKLNVIVFILTIYLVSFSQKALPTPVAQLVECPFRGTGGHGFDLWPRHTKVVKMVLDAPRLTLRLTG